MASPMHEVQRHGAKGLVSGIAKGLVGTVVKPAVGLLDIAEGVSTG
eukprot:SAG25_NODE_8445_length_422_cov_0.804954_1_plen_45_part_10